MKYRIIEMVNLHFFLFYFNFILKGRGSDCAVKINDISVSRIHSKIKIKEGRLILEDNTSKFGTLIQVRDDISISETSTHLQAGRTTVEIYNVKSWKSYFSCICKINKKSIKKLLGNKTQIRTTVPYLFKNVYLLLFFSL